MMSMPIIRVVVIVALLMIIVAGYLYQTGDGTANTGEQAAARTAGLLLLGDDWQAPEFSAAVSDYRQPSATVTDIIVTVSGLDASKLQANTVVITATNSELQAVAAGTKNLQQLAMLLFQLLERVQNQWPESDIYLVLPANSAGLDQQLAEQLQPLLQQSRSRLLLAPAGSDAVYQHATSVLLKLNQS